MTLKSEVGVVRGCWKWRRLISYTTYYMHDGIFHFEILKKNHENFEIFQDSFFEIFHEIFNFQY